MAKEKLDLFKIATRFAAEFSAGASKIVCPEPLDTDLLR
jgi:hypothetical protein